MTVHAPENLFVKIKLEGFTHISAQGFHRIAQSFRMAAGKPFRSGTGGAAVAASRIQRKAARKLPFQRQHLLQHGPLVGLQQGAALFVDVLLTKGLPL